MASHSDGPVANQPRKRPAEDHDPSKPAKRLALQPAIDGDKLCDRCNNIQWSQLMEQVPTSLYGKIVATLSISQEELCRSQCQVCRLLASIKPVRLDSEVCQLKAFSSRLSFAYGRPNRLERRLTPRESVPECTVLYIVPKTEGTKDYIARTGWHQGGCLGFKNSEGGNSKCGPRQILSQSIDYALIKNWMSLCDRKHSKTCSPLRINTLQCLRVIDCQTKSVIDAPTTCRYLALSYVWGHGSKGPSESSEFASVVGDSISVTLSLGFRHLWVDQYCIDQNGPNQQAQIASMDRIYSQAELTLVAGAGVDDSYGLPGVSKRARKPQETIDIGPIKLVQIPPHTSWTLRSSKWASRGWTYQEGILSRRMLVFTDDQVSYLCNAMHCAETANMPPEPLSKTSDTPFIGFLAGAVNYNARNEELWGEYRQIKSHITEFSKRQLTNDSDALNAILGIFNTLQSSKGTLLKHLYGMPIKLSLPSSALLTPLRWYHNKAARRREDFPSWSWTGWDGAVHMTDPDIHVPDDCMIKVRNQPENRTSLFQFMGLASPSWNGGRFSPPKLLLITSKTINVTLRLMTWGNLNDSFSQETQKGRVRFLDGFHAKLPITENVSALVYAYLDQEALPPDGIVGVILGKQESQTGVGILLLEPHGDYYQRVGILRYRDGRGTEAGGDRIPHIVYVDADENVLDEIESIDTCPLWLRGAEVRTVGVE